MREKLSKFFEKDGFYFILFICVCIVAIAAVMVSKGNLDNMAAEPENKEEDFIIVENDLEEEESIEIAKIEDNKVGEEAQEEEDIEEVEAAEVAKVDEDMVIVEDEDEYEEDLEELPSVTEKMEMTLPVSGTIGAGYTENNLIYSETLDKWTAHKGIDIMAPLGTPVVAALSGRVQEVYEDPLWGMVVVLSHEDGLLTKYASLSEDGLIEEGVTVNKGDVIGKVGKTAAIEMVMEPHVHFEVIEDGISINPNIYIPSFMYSN